jgi:uncharacterized lipoprotein YmbA
MTDSIRHTRRSMLAILGAIGLSACGSVRYPDQYVLHVEPPAAPAVSQPSTLKPIAVRRLGCPDYLCDGRIVYRPSPAQVAFYEYHRWAVDPAEALTQLVAKRLSTGAQFMDVEQTEQRTDARYVLKGDIQRFEEIDDGRRVFAVCTISAQVVDANTRAVVWRSTSSETVPVQERTVAGVVTGLSAASRVAVDRLVSELETDLRRREQP